MTATDTTLLVPVTTSVNTLLALTEEQKHTLEQRCRWYQQDENRLRNIDLFLGSHGLPSDYVYVIFRWTDGKELHGGIDPEGRMST